MSRIYFPIYLMLLVACPLWAQSPSATIEATGQTVFCQTGIVQLKIKFTGTAPFGYTYKKIRVSDGKTLSYSSFLTGIHENELTDGYWIESVELNESTKFELVEVFDGTMSQSQWVSYSGTTHGSTNVSGIASFQIDPMPTTNAGTDQTGICGYKATMQAVPQYADSQVFWDAPTLGTFTNINSSAPQFTAPSSGTYTLTFNEKRGACLDQDEVNITVLGSPKATLSGETEICKTGNLQAQVDLEGNSPWSFKVTDGAQNQTFSSISTANYQFPIAVSGTQTYTLAEVSDKNGCKADPSDLIGSAKAINLEPTVFAGADKIVCGQLQTTLEGNADKGVIEWTSVPATTIASPSSLSTNTSANTYAHVEYTLTANNNGCKASDKATVLFSKLPTFNVLSDETTICAGTQTNLSLSTDADGTWTLYYTENLVSKSVELNQKNVSIPLSPSASTDYVFNKIIDKYNCSLEPNIQWTLGVEPLETANAGADQTFDRQYETTLDAQASMAPGKWTVVKGGGDLAVADAADPKTDVTKLAVGENIFRWTLTPQVCPTTSDDVTVKINKYTTYNGFSPNNDGHNDTFIIEGANSDRENELLVFTQKGKLVYKTKNYKNDWNGVGMNGSPLDSGTYYFVFTSKDQPAVKDYLVIRR